MSFTEFVLTDLVSTGSRENEDTLRDISGTVTLTPLITGPVRVPDDPAWTLTTAPITLKMEGGKLVGRDSEDGVRLIAMVDGQAIPWKVERRIVFQGKSVHMTPVTVVSTGEPVHLPDAAPVDEADVEVIGQVLVDLGAVRAELAAAVDAAPRAEDAATRAEDAAAGIGADADSAVDAEQGAVAARTGAESARDEAVGAASTASTKAGEAAASATLADNRATDAVDAREGAEAARDEASGMLAQKADLVGGLVPSSQIPAVAMTRPHVVADVAGLLALDVQEGDVGIIPDGPDLGSYMLGTGPASEFGSWKRLVTPEAPVSSVNGQTGTITLGAADVGAATPTYVDGKVETRATKAEVQARPAMWVWDGSLPWTAPAEARPIDTVLNTSTGEIHAIVEVTA